VVPCNDSSRYTEVLSGFETKDFRCMDELIMEVVGKTLLDDCVRSDTVNAYINHSRGVDFSEITDIPDPWLDIIFDYMAYLMENLTIVIYCNQM
jgi:hypothetical protein